MPLSNKMVKRLQLMLSSLLAQFSVPLAGVLLSVVVVRLMSESFWGAYVAHLLILHLALAVINWGSKDFLVKKFSEEPGSISRHLAHSLLGKGLVALPVLFLLAAIPLEPLHKGLLLAWIVARMGWQAFEPLNTFRRLFLPAALAELFLVGIALAAVWFFRVSLYQFLLVIIATDLLKGLFYFGLNFKFRSAKFNFGGALLFLKEGLPFFLLTFSSLLASRADLYVLGYYESQSALGQYQILVNFVQYAHLMAAAIMLPFLKNIFRLQLSSFYRLEWQFVGLGFFSAMLLTGGIAFLTRYFYGFEFPATVFLIVYLNIFAFYVYFLRIPAGFKHGQGRNVVWVTAAMGITNATLGILLIPKLGIMGGLLASLGASIIGLLGFRTTYLFNFQD